MTDSLPPRIDLPLPEGRPAELAELVNALAGAAFHAGVLDAHLTGPAASAPGWLGADSAAAAEQVGRTATLTREVCDALTGACHRLDAHHQLLVAAIGRIRAMRGAQDDDFAHARVRIDALEGAYGADGAEAQAEAAVLDELRAVEHARAREHARVIDEVARDASDTARLLGRSCRAVGGLGRPDDGGRVLTYLTHELPGWGEQELASLAAEGAGLGAQLAHASPDTVAALLEEHRGMLAAPAFAVAFVATIGPDVLLRFVQWAGLAVGADELPVMLGALMGAADSAAHGDPRIRWTLEAPLSVLMDATTAVGLGRIAGAPGFTPGYRQLMVSRLAAQERDQPTLRRDELAIAPGEDPLAAAMDALAAAHAPDEAAIVLADPAIWPGLLARQWTEGTSALERLIRAAAESTASGSEAAAVVLDAFGGLADALAGPAGFGAPERFSVPAVSGAVGDLVAAHYPVVTASLEAAEGGPGVVRHPLDDGALRTLSGLGIVTQNLHARNTVLEALVRRMQEELPDPSPGAPTPAAFVTGGVFAAFAFGEQASIHERLYSAAEREAEDAAAWALITSALAALPLSRLGNLRNAVTTGMSLEGPGGVPIDAYFAQPETGAFQASFAAVATTVPGLVTAGELPDPGCALDHGVGSAEGLAYEASLTPVQRDLWDRLVGGAHEGYLAVGDGLGILPGSSVPR